MTGSVNAKVEPWPGCECCVRSFFKAEGTLGGIHDRRSSPKKNPGIIAQGLQIHSEKRARRRNVRVCPESGLAIADAVQRPVCKAAVLSRPCPLWVKTRHRSASARRPLYPRKRTLMERALEYPLCAKGGSQTARPPYSNPNTPQQAASLNAAELPDHDLPARGKSHPINFWYGSRRNFWDGSIRTTAMELVLLGRLFWRMPQPVLLGLSAFPSGRAIHSRMIFRRVSWSSMFAIPWVI